jgi:hypothetical protein
MAAHSSRPIAHRAFTIMLAVLLVGSIVAPAFAAQPAAAQSETDQDINRVCETAESWNGVGSPFWVAGVGCQELMGDITEIDPTLTEAGAKTQLIVEGDSEYESAQSYHTLFNNYLSDTPTIASLEAKHAIATSYENGVSPTQADANATKAINDYYAHKQINFLEYYSKQQAQMAHIGNYSQNHPEISKNWAYSHVHANDSTEYPQWHSGTWLTGETETREIELLNGTTHNYTAAVMATEYAEDSVDTSIEAHFSLPLDAEYQQDKNGAERVLVPTEDVTAYDGSGSPYSDDEDILTSGTYRLQGEYQTGNLSDRAVFQYKEWRTIWDEIGSQGAVAQGNYPPGFASDIYDSFESGEISPDEFRGSEGMARYLSGDSEVTSQRFYLATTSLLELDRPALNTTMVIDYDAATTRNTTVNQTTGEIVHQYEDYENATAEGLLFADLPTGSISEGETFTIGDGNDTDTPRTKIVAQNETIHLYNGELTVKSMYDQHGNAVNESDWSQPNYTTYDSAEYIATLENITAQQSEILEQYDEDSGEGISILPDDLFGDVESSGAIVGLVIIGAGVILIVAIVIRP